MARLLESDPLEMLKSCAKHERERAEHWESEAQQDRDAALEKDGYAAECRRVAARFDAAAAALECALEAHP